MKRINNDENGIGGLSFILIIVTVLVAWHIFAPTLNIPSPIDLLTGEKDIVSELYLVDRVTGNEIKLTKGIGFPLWGTNFVQQVEFHVYEIKFVTNAPLIFSDNAYKTVYSYQNVAWLDANSGDLKAFSKPLPISSIWSNTFAFPTNSTNTHVCYFEFHFYNPLGDIISEWELSLGYVPGYGDFP